MPLDGRYVRLGKCNKCGKCCENQDCEHFQNGMCLIFGEPGRPEMCNTFPEWPPIKIATCGFYFYDSWERRTVGYGDKV